MRRTFSPSPSGMISRTWNLLDAKTSPISSLSVLSSFSALARSGGRGPCSPVMRSARTVAACTAGNSSISSGFHGASRSTSSFRRLISFASCCEVLSNSACAFELTFVWVGCVFESVRTRSLSDVSGLENQREAKRPPSSNAGSGKWSAPRMTTCRGCSVKYIAICNMPRPMPGYSIRGRITTMNNVRRSRNWSRTSRCRISRMFLHVLLPVRVMRPPQSSRRCHGRAGRSAQRTGLPSCAGCDAF